MATVTNYSLQVWENGSFWSDVGATAAPVAGHRFVGTALVTNNNQDYVTLTVRDMDDTANPGVVWVREKLAGAWNPSGWVQDNAAALSTKVDKAGDTMTGALTTPGIAIDNGAADGGNLQLMSAGNNEWDIDNLSGTLRFFAPATSIWGTWNSANGSLALAGAVDTVAKNAGALTVAGGLGVGGNVVANNFNVSNTADGGTLNFNNVWAAHHDLSGAGRFSILQQGVNNWLTIAKDTGSVAITSTAASSSPSTGALTIPNGGLGVGGKINAGGGIDIPQSTLVGGGPFAMNIGYPSPYGIALRPSSDTGATPIAFVNAASTSVGSITTSATATAYNTSSDGRLKTDLQPFDAGPIIDATKVYDFAWIATPGERAHGVIAQEMLEVYPQAVTHDDMSDTYGVDYSRFVPLLLQEIKTLRARVAALETAAI
jgi:endosialidase-like protein